MPCRGVSCGWQAVSWSASKPNFQSGCGKKTQRVDDGVGRDDEAIAACHFKRDVARRVACRIQHVDSRQNFRSRLEHGDLFLDGRELALRVFHHAFHVLGHFAGEVRRCPEIPFGFGHMERGVGEDRLAIGTEGSPEMIGVGVGEDDFGDGACLGARGFQAFGEFSGGGLEAAPEPVSMRITSLPDLNSSGLASNWALSPCTMAPSRALQIFRLGVRANT